MKVVALVVALVSSASALLVSPLAAHASQRVPVSPAMACNGGKGGSGGMAPPKDKMRRGRLNALVQAADDAEKVKAILLSSQTEDLLLKMNWKVRSTCHRHLRARATQFGVEVPAAFGAYNVRPRNTPKSALKPTVTEATPAHPAAVAALADLRFS